jgi:hypothetical protein
VTDPSRYRLAARAAGTGLFGLTVAQLAFVAAGVAVAAKTLTAGPLAVTRVAAAAAVLAAAAAVAFTPWRGRPAYEAAPAAIRYVLRAVTGRNRWYARLPLLAADGTPTGPSPTPGCLAGLELLGVPRPAWAGARRSLAPLGVVRDRRSGTMTIAVGVKGAEFQLVDADEQHARIFAWGRVLASFARQSSPVARLSWHEWSSPAPLAEHLAWLEANLDRDAPAAAHYTELLAASAVSVARHDLRVTLTVDPRKTRRAARRAPTRRAGLDALLNAARALIERCREAGLVVGDPLSAAELADALRTGADPLTVRHAGRSLAERAGLIPTVHASPLAVDRAWDHVRVDAALHRVLWVAAWPALDVTPRWLEPLLLDTTGTRTITMVMEPVAPRASRRELRHDTVKVHADIHNRSSHGFHVPVELQRARAGLDQREAELAAGFAEYRYLALIDVCAPTLDALDQLTTTYIDAAATCGLELRALDGRHDAAWACCLPIGRAPDRDLIGGLSG